LITPAQLREALSLAQRTNRKLGEVLVDEGFVEQEQLTRALAMPGGDVCGIAGRDARRSVEEAWRIRVSPDVDFACGFGIGGTRRIDFAGRIPDGAGTGAQAV